MGNVQDWMHLSTLKGVDDLKNRTLPAMSFDSEGLQTMNAEGRNGREKLEGDR